LDIPNTYIEVKAYQRDRDIAKWKQFPHTLFLIKKKEIIEIKNNMSTLDKDIKECMIQNNKF